jgi:integrase/recombinase XerC
MIRRLSDRAGFKARPHGIRHAAVTAVLDATGGDVRKAQAFARHKSAATTMVYDDNRADLGGQASKILGALVE